MYILRCNQRGTTFPAGEEPEKFKSLDFIKGTLLTYHYDAIEEENQIDFKNMTAQQLADFFDWTIEKA